MKNFTPLPDWLKKQNITSGHFSKEIEPPKKSEVIIIREKVEREIEDEEVKPFIKTKPETIKLPPDLKKIGVKTPISSPKIFTYQEIKAPISDEKIIQGLHQPITSSFRWLATLALYILKMAKIKLKVVKGKVVRVLTG